MKTAVDALKDQVDRAFDEAERTLDEEIKIIIADHSAKGLIQSGATIRRVAKALELATKAAVRSPRDAAQKRSSIVLRVKLSHFEAGRGEQLRAMAEDRLERIGLGDRAGKVLLHESVTRSLRADPPQIEPKPSGARQILAAVGAWIGQYVVPVIATLVVGILTAYIVYRLGWN